MSARAEPTSRGAIVLLSGPVAAGKTSLARELVRRYGFRRLATRDLILRRLPATPLTRSAMQRAGDYLDSETDGGWVAHGLVQFMRRSHSNRIVIDSVRIEPQVDAVRSVAPNLVVHVHLTAPLAVLATRYKAKGKAIQELASYGHVRRHPTEKRVHDLAPRADVLIDTSTAAPARAAVEVALRLWPQYKNTRRRTN
jgi:adenylosuccinate synthase